MNILERMFILDVRFGKRSLRSAIGTYAPLAIVP
jgi:hypothetical protein